MKEFSAATRAKLSASMKARWRRVKEEAQQAEINASLPSMLGLYEAAAALVEDEELKAAVMLCAETRTMVCALDECGMEGTNLQKRLRRTLVSKILHAIGSTAEG